MSKYRSLRLAFTILIFLICKVSLSQTNNNRTKESRILEAYGYLKGQEYQLNKIREQHSNLSISVLQTELKFKVSFGIAIIEIQRYLKNLLADKFSNMDLEYHEQVVKIFGSQKMSSDEALTFLDEVKTRSKGNIPSPILETLLHFNYINNPSKEFSAGYVKTFRTKGHPKAKGTDWQIKVPLSWSQKEGDRPNIIQMFQSEYGDGNESISIMVQELPKDLGLSKSDLNEIFLEENMKVFVPKNAKYLSSKKLILDNYNGGVLEMEIQMQRLDIMIKMRVLQFMLIKKDKLFMLMAGTGSPIVDLNLSKEMEKYRPLFNQVANSIVVLDQYR